LEEYAVLLQIDTLMVRQESNNTQADLADLRAVPALLMSKRNPKKANVCRKAS